MNIVVQSYWREDATFTAQGTGCLKLLDLESSDLDFWGVLLRMCPNRCSSMLLQNAGVRL